MASPGWLLPLLIACSTGCAGGGTFDRVPGQDLAEKVTWIGLYEEASDPPPVEWFHNDSGYLSDTIGNTGITLPGWKVQVAISSTTCPAGLYYDMPEFDCSISSSSYAHELMHWRTYLRTGDVDALHKRGDWQLAGDRAFYALVKNGL